MPKVQTARSTKLPRVLGRRFIIKRDLGRGAYGRVVSAYDAVNERSVALKIEDSRLFDRASMEPALYREYNFYRFGGPIPGVSSMRWCGIHGPYNLLAIDELGPTLQARLDVCNGHFHLKTVLILADQLFKRIQQLHARGIVHGDLKPENLLFGNPEGPARNVVHLVDLGLAKLWRDPQTGEHNPFFMQGDLTGNQHFASVNMHWGCASARRDDIESIVYILIYLLHGCLPWDALASRPLDEHMCVASMKASIAPQELCEGLPAEFAAVLEYARGLDYEDKPDYRGIRRAFRRLFDSYTWVDDGSFEWACPVRGVYARPQQKLCQLRRLLHRPYAGRADL
ncbi:casein kinase [Fistulina hepatica ATCC 64428]|nr:casein kinase [Fistulina hepatica ATCC 64428]